MKNEFGVPLDRNGYAPTVVQYDLRRCAICGQSNVRLQRHEPFNGANRQKSKRLGLWVVLCQECHNMVHMYPQEFGNTMKRETQSRAMRFYKWSYEDWKKRFGKNWL